jgi:hypothetical protein
VTINAGAPVEVNASILTVTRACRGSAASLQADTVITNSVVSASYTRRRQHLVTRRTQWLAPSPLGDELSAATNKVPLRAPGLLRFATDTFMEDLQNVLSKATPSLRDYVAQPESWSAPLAGASACGSAERNPAAQALPARSPRFYLVAPLTCRVPGCRITPSNGRRASG